MIYIGLGANLDSQYGRPEQALLAAIGYMKKYDIQVLQSSRVYVSAPVPASDQPWYRNMVVSVSTELTPQALISTLHKIEEEMGRVRSYRNAPRIIDLDLLSYHDCILYPSQEISLYIPHPRMCERAFVVFPLFELCPEWVHPVSGMTISQIKAQIGCSQDIMLLDEVAA